MLFNRGARLGLAAGLAGILATASFAPTTRADKPADPVVAKVDGQAIHLSELKEAAQSLPQGAQSVPPQALMPMMLDQVIDAHALVAEARRTGLDKDPEVQRQLQAAQDRALQTALLRKEIGPEVTDEALEARYKKEIAGKPGEEEVHARHILVPDEATAKKIIAELKKGADFAALSKQYSKDPGSAENGGDLGFFKQQDMVPEFAKAAFALQPGQISDTPVHTQFGWHVIEVVERRQEPAPTFEQVRDQLRQKTIQEGVRKVVAQARASVSVEKFNLDGSPVRPTDNAEPPSK